MRVAIVADLHVHDWQEFSVAGSRLLHTVSVIADVVSYCKENGIGVIIIGGDLFHKRGVVFTRPFNLVVKELVAARDAGITVLTVDGNHDHADRAGTEHPFQALEDAGLVSTVHNKGWINWHLQDGSDELLVCGFSFCDSRADFYGRIDASVKEARKHYRSMRRIAICHHGFKGAKVGSALEYTVKEDIDVDPLRDSFDFLFSGHYHQRQLIGGRENMMYIGSPLELVRGDGGLDKGFLVYDSEKVVWKLVKLDRPKFVKLTQEQIDSPKGYADIIRGNFVDVVYHELPMSQDDFVYHLQHCGAAGVKLLPIPRAKTPSGTRLAIDPSLDSKTLIDRYLDFKKADIEGMDRTELLRLGTDLITRSTK